MKPDQVSEAQVSEAQVSEAQVSEAQVSEAREDRKPYRTPRMVVVGAVDELTGGPVTTNQESYGFQA
jgi:hypothetical protein